MSRVIKFRVWDTRVNAYRHYCNERLFFVSGPGTHSLGRFEFTAAELFKNQGSTHEQEFVSPYFNGPILIPEQFTGLLDSKGREIYEGDIVLAQKYKDPTQEKLTGLVLWADYGDGEYVECLETWMLHWVLCDGVSDRFATPLSCAIRSGGVRWSRGFSIWPGTVEVIGNIHENPDLLKP